MSRPPLVSKEPCPVAPSALSERRPVEPLPVFSRSRSKPQWPVDSTVTVSNRHGAHSCLCPVELYPVVRVQSLQCRVVWWPVVLHPSVSSERGARSYACIDDSCIVGRSLTTPCAVIQYLVVLTGGVSSRNGA